MKEPKPRSLGRLLLLVLGIFSLCAAFIYGFVFMEHPFHPQAGGVYRLADGRTYFELVVAGPESTVEDVRYFTGFSTEGDYQIKLGYTLCSANLFAPKTSRKTYAFIRNVSDAGDLDAIHAVTGREALVLWQGGDAVPPAPADIEEKAWSGVVPYITY